MEAAYRPKTRQSPATDYDKWDAWARNLPPEDTERGAVATAHKLWEKPRAPLLATS